MNTSKSIIKTREMEILDDATTTFERETGLVLKMRGERQTPAGDAPDAVLELVRRGAPIKYFAEVRLHVTEITIGKLAHKFHGQPERWLLVTRFVPNNLAKKLRDLRIQFIDTVGNAYINRPHGVYIFTTGSKPVHPFRLAAQESVLGGADVLVIFALLNKQELGSATYREIAQEAGVALGAVAGVMRNLTRQGFLTGHQREKRTLMRKQELLDKWLTAYAEKLRPKKLIGRYTADQPAFWQHSDLQSYNARWGGEVAANKLTHYLKPEVITIYTRRPLNDIVLGLKLRTDENGTVELRERFWHFEDRGQRKDIVPPLLVYADLLATADARNIEAAKQIYDEFLDRYFRES